MKNFFSFFFILWFLWGSFTYGFSAIPSFHLGYTEQQQELLAENFDDMYFMDPIFYGAQEKLLNGWNTVYTKLVEKSSSQTQLQTHIKKISQVVWKLHINADTKIKKDLLGYLYQLINNSLLKLYFPLVCESSISEVELSPWYSCEGVIYEYTYEEGKLYSRRLCRANAEKEKMSTDDEYYSDLMFLLTKTPFKNITSIQKGVNHVFARGDLTDWDTTSIIAIDGILYDLPFSVDVIKFDNQEIDKSAFFELIYRDRLDNEKNFFKETTISCQF